MKQNKKSERDRKEETQAMDLAASPFLIYKAADTRMTSSQLEMLEVLPPYDS